MVGVGPGVGADIIRQRRKRADKLKKEQKVRHNLAYDGLYI